MHKNNYSEQCLTETYLFRVRLNTTSFEPWGRFTYNDLEENMKYSKSFGQKYTKYNDVLPSIEKSINWINFWS